MDDLGCPTCGSYENWEVQQLKRTSKDGLTFTYDIKCLKCGRVMDYVTDNPDAVPERAKIREELLTPALKFDPTRKYESDMAGFDPAKVKPRLKGQE